MGLWKPMERLVIGEETPSLRKSPRDHGSGLSLLGLHICLEQDCLRDKRSLSSSFTVNGMLGLILYEGTV